MTEFKTLNIQAPETTFTGDKIKLSKLLNTPIKVIRYKIEESKFKEKGNGQRLVLQLEKDGTTHVLFSSSITLQAMIKQVPENKFPFTTTIQLINERPQFT